MFAIAFGLDDNQHLSRAPLADCHESALSHGIKIFDAHGEWVVEHSLGIRKRNPMLLEVRGSLYWVVLEGHSASVYILYAYRKPRALRGLTTELSGRPRRPCRGQTRPTMVQGPLEALLDVIALPPSAADLASCDTKNHRCYQSDRDAPQIDLDLHAAGMRANTLPVLHYAATTQAGVSKEEVHC
jgi:hypothetical protein